jgi:tRNA modification GTPase
MPSRMAGKFRIEDNGRDGALEIPGHLLLWPSSHSYTRQPSAELHTIGSPPLLAAVIEELGRHGVRTAQPGEFTLRAFLAGRIDLTQAEAVLGVIDARERSDLDAALDQLAGGLSRPLQRLREVLLAVLAELEAGLDFVEEDIEFISRTAIRQRLAEAERIVAATLAQMSSRDVRRELPRVVIHGPPNAGKSSLFNVLLKRYGEHSPIEAIVSPQPGATRDFISATMSVEGIGCLLIDTAGEDASSRGEIHAESQQLTKTQRHQADIRLFCVDGAMQPDERGANRQNNEIIVYTKSDLRSASPARPLADDISLHCSSVTGEGLGELAAVIRARIAADDGASAGTFAAATSARCSASLHEAKRALAAAVDLTETGGDELIAAELRAALDALGDVVGATTADDLLDRIFRQFCIGK